MIRLGYHRFLPLLLAVLPATAAPRGKADSPAFRLAAVSPSVKPEMTRYSLTALENCDATNALKALLYTPKPIGMARLPMVVYLPGKGELGELEVLRVQAADDLRPRCLRRVSGEVPLLSPCHFAAEECVDSAGWDAEESDWNAERNQGLHSGDRQVPNEAQGGSQSPVPDGVLLWRQRGVRPCAAFPECLRGRDPNRGPSAAAGVLYKGESGQLVAFPQ